MEYDFTTLSPTDFENLVGDLLSRSWSITLESFKPGKDQGIDLRHVLAAPRSDSTIVQCKRYAPHKFRELIRSLKEEKEKLAAIRPGRYVLATSVNLSPRNKEEILDILSPWCHSTADIYGPGELNRLLRLHKDVERSHFKLWIASTTVLEKVLHANIFSITDATIELTKDQLSKLVVHAGLEKSLQILNESHHVLIVGNPGIGKTTLARMLMCHYITEGYEPIWVVNNVQEAWSLVQSAAQDGIKKLIVYDDFLGSVNFDSHRFGKNEDHALMLLLEKVNRSNNLRFILTTREYILEDAKRLHGVFQYRSDELHKFILSLEEYTEIHRAQMLFNHLYFSSLSDAKLEMLVHTKVYKEVVSHRNFNPRIIESVCRDHRSHSLNDIEFISFVQREFDDPSMLWMHPFENEISPVARHILMVLWSHGGQCSLESLRSSVFMLNQIKLPEEISKALKDALRQLDGNFIRTDIFPELGEKSDRLIVRFQNPSVEDLINRVAQSNYIWLSRLLEGATSFRQLQQVFVAASKLSGQESVPKEFWQRLREAAETLETSTYGALVNYTGFGSTHSKKYWMEQRINLAESTLFRLKIEEFFPTDDQLSKDLKYRVLSINGWGMLIANSANSNFEAYSASLLQKWIANDSNLMDSEKLASEELLTEAVISLIQNSWTPLSIDCLDDFYSACTRLRQDLTTHEKEVFSKAALAKVSEHLSKSDDVEELRNEAFELESLSSSLGADFQTLQQKLLDKASDCEESEEETGRPLINPEESNYSQNERNRFDIDELFEDLLDR